MIIDKIANMKLYSAVVPELETVADYLAKTNLEELECGSYEICEGVRINVSEYEPFAEGDKWEVHRKYADVHMVICGDEKLDCACTIDGVGGEYNEEGDYMFMDSMGECITTTALKPGSFVYCAPHDGHRPGIKLTSDKVKKAVVKIPYNR